VALEASLSTLPWWRDNLLLFGKGSNRSTKNFTAAHDPGLGLERIEKRQILVREADRRLLRHVGHLYVTS
jgi:hypothetical protein